MHKRQRKRGWIGRITCLNYTDFGVHLFFFFHWMGLVFLLVLAKYIFFNRVCPDQLMRTLINPSRF